MVSRSRKFLQALCLFVGIIFSGCAGDSSPVTPPKNSDLLSISVSRFDKTIPQINKVNITVNRKDESSLGISGHDIEISVSSGSITAVIDRGNGIYEALWTGNQFGEILVNVRDQSSDPIIESSLTFLALEFLHSDWDVPVKLESPISSDGWEASPFIYPEGNKIAFSYITLDLAALSANIIRSIGEERPGYFHPQTLNIFLAEKKSSGDWDVKRAGMNNFQSIPMMISSPSVTSDLSRGFCTVQDFVGGNYSPSAIYVTDPEFSFTPTPLGAPVDIDGFGEANPYFSASSGFLFFDVFDLSDPLSKQDIMVARSLGGTNFDTPYEIGGFLNTTHIETQPFVHEPLQLLYFASDRDRDEFQLAIYRAPLFSDSAGTPEMVASGMVALGNPSVTYDGKLFCFAYAREEIGGINSDIAICRKL